MDWNKVIDGLTGASGYEAMGVPVEVARHAALQGALAANQAGGNPDFAGGARVGQGIVQTYALNQQRAQQAQYQQAQMEQMQQERQMAQQKAAQEAAYNAHIQKLYMLEPGTEAYNRQRQIIDMSNPQQWYMAEVARDQAAAKADVDARAKREQKQFETDEAIRQHTATKAIDQQYAEPKLTPEQKIAEKVAETKALDAAKGPSDQQRAAAARLRTIREAEDSIPDITPDRLNIRFFDSKAEKAFDDGAEAWINAALGQGARGEKLTGARIKEAKATYFPVPGDGEAERANKAKMRAAIEEGIAGEAGMASQDVPHSKKYAAMRGVQQTAPAAPGEAPAAPVAPQVPTTPQNAPGFQEPTTLAGRALAGAGAARDTMARNLGSLGGLLGGMPQISPEEAARRKFVSGDSVAQLGEQVTYAIPAAAAAAGAAIGMAPGAFAAAVKAGVPKAIAAVKAAGPQAIKWAIGIGMGAAGLGSIKDAISAEERPSIGALAQPGGSVKNFTKKDTATPEFRTNLDSLESAHELPKGLLRAIMATESGGDPKAVSPVGAKGAFQFMPKTAEQYGLKGKEFNPVESAKAAARFLGDLLKKYGGNTRAAIAHYNGGERAARAVLSGKEPPQEETRKYVKLVTNRMTKDTQSA